MTKPCGKITLEIVFVLYVSAVVAPLLVAGYLIDRHDRRRRGRLRQGSSGSISRSVREANRDARVYADNPMTSGDVSWTEFARRNRGEGTR